MLRLPSPKGKFRDHSPLPSRVPQQGSSPHPALLWSPWGGRIALCPRRGICPRSFSRHQGGESRQERSWWKATRGSAAAQKLPCSPHRAQRPLPHRDGKPSSTLSFITPAFLYLPLGYEMFSGEKNLMFNTFPPPPLGFHSVKAHCPAPWGHRLLVIQ